MHLREVAKKLSSTTRRKSRKLAFVVESNACDGDWLAVTLDGEKTSVSIKVEGDLAIYDWCTDREIMVPRYQDTDLKEVALFAYEMIDYRIRYAACDHDWRWVGCTISDEFHCKKCGGYIGG